MSRAGGKENGARGHRLPVRQRDRGFRFLFCGKHSAQQSLQRLARDGLEQITVRAHRVAFAGKVVAGGDEHQLHPAVQRAQPLRRADAVERPFFQKDVQKDQLVFSRLKILQQHLAGGEKLRERLPLPQRTKRLFRRSGKKLPIFHAVIHNGNLHPSPPPISVYLLGQIISNSVKKNYIMGNFRLQEIPFAANYDRSQPTCCFMSHCLL